MAEELLPTVAPGMVGLRNKKTKMVSAHFPVDAREILTTSAGEYEIVDNGAVEAARMNANPLKALEANRALIHSEVTGIDGQVLVAMSPEDAEKWRAMTEASAGQEKPAESSAPSTETKTAESTGDGSKTASKPAGK